MYSTYKHFDRCVNDWGCMCHDRLTQPMRGGYPQSHSDEIMKHAMEQHDTLSDGVYVPSILHHDLVISCRLSVVHSLCR